MGNVKIESNKPEFLSYQVAGNGLLDRRLFLSASAKVFTSVCAVGFPSAGIAAEKLVVPPWTMKPGKPSSPYGEPARFEHSVVRSPTNIGAASMSFTPLESLDGILTPNGLHFERHHNGVPDIDPARHKLAIHGKVGKSLLFTMEDVLRYPRTSVICFVECSGNSGFIPFHSSPQPWTAGKLHGQVSCSEWSGIPLSILLDEASLGADARWVIAEGADSVAMTRSIPIAKAMDDAMIALFQNGERLRPENGYPMRLLLPGWEGSASVKWLRRLEVTSAPGMTREETARYTDLQPDGRTKMFSFEMGVKSVITSPSGQQRIARPGYVQISGIAWSGAGRIRRVEVSADGGNSWAACEMGEPVLPKALTRFRIPWHWDGQPCVLMSRAVDETDAVQPTRRQYLNTHGKQQIYHYNGIQCWAVGANGEVTNTYA